MSQPSKKKVDGVFRTRSLGAAASGLVDQYADGKAAKLWSLYVGAKEKRRSPAYRDFLLGVLRHRRRVLDVACGTGVDSVALIEADLGFEVVSADASDKMLKAAYETRWARRKESADFDSWRILEANWLTLSNDLDHEANFDAVLCLGNSFAHLPDPEDQLKAIENFRDALNPDGGVLIIDHRNYDAILATGKTPVSNVYYDNERVDAIKTSVLYVDNEAKLVTLDYTINADIDVEGQQSFRLSYFPHRLDAFTGLLKRVFGDKAVHKVYGDFEENPEHEPGFFIHIIERNL